MTDPPPVIALIVTYRRLDLAIATIQSVKRDLEWPNIGFHIADDGSGMDYIDKLKEEIGPTYSITYTNSEGKGVARNMNLGINACLDRADLWLHLEDDWILPKPLSLEPFVRLLTEDDSIGMIRMGRLSAGITAETYGGADKVWWLMKKKSDTYVFSGNPSLRHRRFAAAYGRYSENRDLGPGQVELSYCNSFNTKPGPGIVWPGFLSVDDAYRHIGDHQSYKWYMENEGLTSEEVALKFETNS